MPQGSVTRHPTLGQPTTVANTAIAPVQSTATTTYTGSTVPLSVARRQHIHAVERDNRPRKEGWVIVREGGFMQSWKQRYMILRNEWIDFTKAEDGKTIYTLFLNEVMGIGRAETGIPTIEIRRKIEGSSTSPGEKEESLKLLHIRVKSEKELYAWIDFIHIACPGLGGVSNPTNFFHEVHVGFDAAAKQFIGLPQEWVQLLSTSAITKDDYARNPQAVIEAVDFYADLQNQSDNPSEYLALAPTKIERLEKDLPAVDPQAAPVAERAATTTKLRPKPQVQAEVDPGLPPPLAPTLLPIVPVGESEVEAPQPFGASAEISKQPAQRHESHVYHAPEAQHNSGQLPREAARKQELDALPTTVTPLDIPSRRRQALRHVTTSEAELLAKLRPLVSDEDPTTCYQKHKKIGQGASGSVYVATVRPTATGIAQQLASTKGPQLRVAIKEMSLARQQRKEALVDEISIMKESQHKNVINFLDAFLVGNRVLWVVMDYMDGGALIDLIDNNPQIHERHIATICREVSETPCCRFLEADPSQTCLGLQHLHSKQIVHRDIKSDNVLIDARGSIKISTWLHCFYLQKLALSYLITSGSRFWILCKTYSTPIEACHNGRHNVLDGARSREAKAIWIQG